MSVVPPFREAPPLRNTLHRSRLVRQLSAWTGEDAAAGGPDTAQRLSAWVGVAEAIGLHAAHQSVQAAGAAWRASPRAARTAQPPHNVPHSREPASPTAAAALEAELQQTRDALIRAIRAPFTAGLAPRRGLRTPPTARQTPAGPPADFAPYHQRHLDVQRQMELRIDALRNHARALLMKSSARLAQLATLDAALEPLLAGREQRLLSTLTSLLEKRFQQLRKAARAAAEEAGATDPSAVWLHGFAREFQEALLGELEVRLQPVTGLAEALRNEHV